LLFLGFHFRFCVVRARVTGTSSYGGWYSIILDSGRQVRLRRGAFEVEEDGQPGVIVAKKHTPATQQQHATQTHRRPISVNRRRTPNAHKDKDSAYTAKQHHTPPTRVRTTPSSSSSSASSSSTAASSHIRHSGSISPSTLDSGNDSDLDSDWESNSAGFSMLSINNNNSTNSNTPSESSSPTISVLTRPRPARAKNSRYSESEYECDLSEYEPSNHNHSAQKEAKSHNNSNSNSNSNSNNSSNNNSSRNSPTGILAHTRHTPSIFTELPLNLFSSPHHQCRSFKAETVTKGLLGVPRSAPASTRRLHSSRNNSSNKSSNSNTLSVLASAVPTVASTQNHTPHPTLSHPPLCAHSMTPT
jgi:hypothetical protein